MARSEARLRGILDSAMDAIITVDDTQHVVLFNAAAEAMFGCPRREALGAPLAWFIPERFRGVHGEHVRHFGETGTASRRMGALRIVTGLRRNGEEFPIDASISQLDESGGKFYTVILRDVSERVRVEEALRRSKEELRELGAAANAAREQEKSRIARELHDELAQSLTALQMDVAWCKEKIPEGQSATVARLAKMEAVLDETVAATRRIAADLRPLMLDDLGLVPAVEWLTETFAERTRIPCELAVDDAELDLPSAQATAVFRIVQESLANVAKHARASRVKVAIERRGSDVALSIRDDGAGFSPEAPRKPNSYGLLGLRERASLLGGEVTDHQCSGPRDAHRSPPSGGATDPGVMIRVVIADDHTIVREGLKQLLFAESDLEVVDEARDGHEVLQIVREHEFDVLLLDLSMPGKGGMDLIKQVKGEKPKLRILVLSMHAEHQYAVRAIKAGASGYLTKDSASTQLLSAIRKVAGGGAVISAEVAEQLALSAMPHADGPPHASLSDREYQVFQLLVGGDSVSDIAQQLNLSVKTVSTHKARLMEKMGLANQTELIRYAIRHRLIDDSAAPG